MMPANRAVTKKRDIKTIFLLKKVLIINNFSFIKQKNIKPMILFLLLNLFLVALLYQFKKI